MIPAHLLPHTVTVVRPAASTDSHGNTVLDYGAGATRTQVRAWLQQDHRSEPLADGRDPLVQRWLLVTNHRDIHGRDRIEWSDMPGVTWEVDGPPAPLYTPSQGYHHLEANLRVVEG